MDVVKTGHMRELEKRETSLLWKDSKLNGFWDLKDLTVSFHLIKTCSRLATVKTVERKNVGKKCLKNYLKKIPLVLAFSALGHPDIAAGEPLFVVSPHYPGDHKTLSISGHVGFHVIFTSIHSLGHSSFYG